MVTYYIYEVPGHKNGATKDWDKRSRENFEKYQIEPVIIETMQGPNESDFWQIVGDREWELADQNGYPRGTHYRIARETRPKWDSTSASEAGKIGGCTGGLNTSPIPGLASKGVPRRACRKLTFKQAEEIRSKYVPRKYGLHKLGKEYGVDYQVIHRIVNNLCYLKA